MVGTLCCNGWPGVVGTLCCNGWPGVVGTLCCILVMQIPTDAVEMPSDTVDELGIQFGNLGIGFGDSSVNEPLEAAPEVWNVGVAQPVLQSVVVIVM